MQCKPGCIWFGDQISSFRFQGTGLMCLSCSTSIMSPGLRTKKQRCGQGGERAPPHACRLLQGRKLFPRSLPRDLHSRPIDQHWVLWPCELQERTGTWIYRGFFIFQRQRDGKGSRKSGMGVGQFFNKYWPYSSLNEILYIHHMKSTPHMARCLMNRPPLSTSLASPAILFHR